jgi:hypothetical protein
LGILSKGISGGQQSHKQIIVSAKKQIIDVVKTKSKEDTEQVVVKPFTEVSNRKSVLCTNEDCAKIREELQRLKN